jgi:hypothetical protein
MQTPKGIVDPGHRKSLDRRCNTVASTEREHPVNAVGLPVGDPETDFSPRISPKAGTCIGSTTPPTTCRTPLGAARDRIRRWQAPLRSLYLLQAPILQFRIFAATDLKSRSFTTFEDDFRFECSRIFKHVAESLEHRLVTRTHRAESATSIVDRIDSSQEKLEAEFSERERALLRLNRTIAQLVDRLQSEVASEGFYDV